MRQILLLLTIAAAIVGCRREEPRRVVGVVPKGATQMFWQTVHAGAAKAAREYRLDLEWNAPAPEIDAARQAGIVNSMIDRHLAGIALAPADRTSLVSVVERADRAGIPVAILDSPIDTDKRVIYVASDNRAGGRESAQALADTMMDEGQCAILTIKPAPAEITERVEGFVEEIRKHPNIKLIETFSTDPGRSKASDAMDKIITKYPQLNGLMITNGETAMGAAITLEARANTKIRAVAFDNSEQLIEDMRHRIIDAMLVQDPFRMGYESVKAIGMKLNGKTPESHIDSGITIVTRADMEKPDIIPLLYPDVQKYLSAPVR